MRKTKIAVADDQHLFRKGLISLLGEFHQLKVIAEANNGKDLLEKLKTKQPDVILLDLEMPEMDGLLTTQFLKDKYPYIKVLVLTMHNEDSMILHLIENGADGFLLKDEPIETIVDAINAVIEHGYYFNDRINYAMVQELVHGKKIIPKCNQALLTDREIQVVKLMCREFTTKEIADKLCLAVRTIEGHRESILVKIKAKNIAGVVMYAVKNELV